MKVCLFSILLFASTLTGHAQKGIFTFYDSSVHVKEISRTLVDQVVFEDKSYAAYTDIIQVEFDETVHITTLDFFRSKNVLVIVSGKIPGAITQSASPTYPSHQLSDSERIDQLEKSLDAFRQSRTTGKTVGILGALGLSAYFLLSNKYVNEVKKGNLDAKPPSVVIPIVSSVVLGLSFAIDSSAGDHLKRKR